MTKYTGRQIAIFTDIHGLLYPTIAILNDIKKRGISEIYSLGDNIGVGPNPSQILDLLGENGVTTINGNSEDYSTLGIAPFSSYFSPKKIFFYQIFVHLKKYYSQQICCIKNTYKKI